MMKATSTPGGSKRELLILAAISLATTICMGLLAEASARIWWPEATHNACIDNGALRPRANCIARIKNAEGPWTTVTYNACGYRSEHPCGAKLTGVRRVVVMGSSVAEGLYVRSDEFFATRLERALSKRCGLPVEAHSMGSLSVPQDRQMLLVPEVLALAPDLVILPFLPYDLASFAEEAKPVKTTGEPLARFPTEMASTFLTQLRHYLRESRALVIAQHFLLENDSHLLLRAYQLGGEEDALRVPSSVAFERRYARLEAALAELARSLSAHGVPLILLPVPNRIQAALLSGDATLPNVNPWAFSWEMEAIGARAGIQMANVFQKFASRPRAELLFYAIDGHPSGDAHALMADAVDELLRNRAVPAFADCFRT